MAGRKKAAGRGRPGRAVEALPKAETTPPPQFDGRSFLTSMGMGRTSTTYQTKQVVYRQGDQADAVHYIQAGRVRLTVVSEQGKEGVIAMLGAGEFFGEGCIAMQPLRMSSASTMVKSTIVRIEKAVMLRLLHDQPCRKCSCRSCCRATFRSRPTW
jgi:CRP/FNR family cyclic AMP-dependent transcriptional regulator